MTLLYEKESYKLRGFWMKIYNELGPGLKESVYANAFEELLKEESIPYQREPNLSVEFRGKRVGNYRPDFLVFDEIIVELKSIPQIPKVQIQRVYQYLSSSRYKLGFIVNFGQTRLQIIRRIYDRSYTYSDKGRDISVKSVVNQSNPRMKGFTLIELLLVIAILALLVAGSLPLAINFYNTRQLSVHEAGIVQALRRAQLKSMSGEQESSFGVYIVQGQYILFKGSSFAARDPSSDEVSDLPDSLSISGLSEIVYTKLEGIPSDTGNIILTLGSKTETININEVGRVEY